MKQLQDITVQILVSIVHTEISVSKGKPISERYRFPKAIGAYTKVIDGENTEYSYMQPGTPNENEKYCFVSYNLVVNMTSDEEVTQ